MSAAFLAPFFLLEIGRFVNMPKGRNPSMTRTIFLALFLLGVSLPAMAEDVTSPAPEAAAPVEEKKAEEQKPEEVELPPEAKAHQKAAEEVFALTKEVAEGISPAEQKHFFILYNNYNLIGTVKMVQEDVGEAVKACGKENPEMKEALDARFKQWSDAVNPVMKDAEANVQNMVAAQEYAKPDKIKQVFKGLDKTRKLANAQIEKTPVTTKDACEYLQGKMTDTQENFIKILQSTLMSAPQAMPGEEEPAAGEPAEAPKEEPKAEETQEKAE
jgi:hypothetical protein